MTLDDIVTLLSDVRGFVDIPQKVQSAQEEKVRPNMKSRTKLLSDEDATYKTCRLIYAQLLVSRMRN